MKKIGLIAGRGKLPYVWARAAKAKGKEVCVFSLNDQIDNLLWEITDWHEKINFGELNKLIKKIHTLDINEIVMMGKVEKSVLFKDLKLDNRMKELIESLHNLNDDSILLALVNEFKKEGIEVLKQSTYLEDIFPEPGLLTNKKPGDDLLADMKFGFKMAKEIGRLDIGQTVIVKNRAVLAVEAIEGTDKTIKRGGKLGGKGITMVKVSKPQQDWRFDLPTIGTTTLKNLIKAGARGLVVEARKTFLIEGDILIEMAEGAGITVMAMDYYIIG